MMSEGDPALPAQGQEAQTESKVTVIMQNRPQVRWGENIYECTKEKYGNRSMT